MIHNLEDGIEEMIEKQEDLLWWIDSQSEAIMYLFQFYVKVKKYRN